MNFNDIIDSTKLVLLVCLCLSCSSEEKPSVRTTENSVYTTDKEQIFKNGIPVHLNGVNALNSFGIDDSALMQDWNIKIVREFIGNLREQPIAGNPVRDSKNQWLHPLQEIVEMHRQNGRVTILCPFGWVDSTGNQQLFTGLNPSEQVFFEAYKERMKSIANQFKGQSDVWIELWNEPYAFDNSKGYTHNLWLEDQLEMIQNLRETGFDNIILVPGNAQGQSEEAILALGNQITTTFRNIVFDLHAYENWLIGTSETTIQNRIKKLKNLNFPIIFGEIGVINASGLMQVQAFLKVANQTQTPTLAWIWKSDQNDQNALLDSQNNPNDLNNNSWGTTFFKFLTD
ncbi:MULTISPECIES: cellulase family glycosylhydrolase [unclassified Leeuwenhoekiella]|uniref:cellulase family glycosylhydrolase n=1 Tax=unclassified Leeuwenhoekiella TaxID=2615029 RepID=UPI0025B98371|nr:MULTISPECIES: cellulase family glycosylhydrolase [unclassified Leeuwenhoekiella]|tara:strand:- start:8764 stop:9792 length:1029 start_codon:yes stop_codon:yes gene_type:complete